MSKFQAWLYALRLRTLPLALSCIITGGSIAYVDNKLNFSWLVFGLCVLTTLLLQILSNLANDYGDSAKGTDNDERIGPKRAIQAGILTPREITIGIIICITLCLLSGIALIKYATLGLHPANGLFFFLLGIASIAAAIKYTVGRGAYGYMGLGDLFVLLFFGLVGVGGSYYLMAHQIHYSVALPAYAIGAFATAVLNLNNMRDHESDARAGKITLVVRIGLPAAKRYHAFLLISGLLATLVFVVLNCTSSMQFAFILIAPLFRKHIMAVWHITELREFDPLLKQMAISTFIFSLLFAFGMIVGSVS